MRLEIFIPQVEQSFIEDRKMRLEIDMKYNFVAVDS
jgi:hypothetical protein